MDLSLALVEEIKMESYKFKWPIYNFFTTIDHLELDMQEFYSFLNTISLFFIKFLPFF